MNSNLVLNEYVFIHMNNMIDICTEACAACYNFEKILTSDTEAKLKYIESKVKLGHESVIEHSNMILLLIIGKTKRNDIDVIKFLTQCKYVNVEYINDNDRHYILLGGSVRGIKHIYKNLFSVDNAVIKTLTKAIYENLPKQFFSDLIKDEIMREENFLFTENNTTNNVIESTNIDKVDIMNFDEISDSKMNMLFKLGFINSQIYNMMTCTILFKNMSRTGTHQLVRHRNAISQESQRYVDYSDAPFISPCEFKDKYDGSSYGISMNKEILTMPELGKEISAIYRDLLEAGVEKEDARAFLPSNIASGKVYMTFTCKNLLKFLELRTDKHAQAEIRYFANIIKDSLSKSIFIGEETIEKYIHTMLAPKYIYELLGSTGNVEDLYHNLEEIIEE